MGCRDQILFSLTDFTVKLLCPRYYAVCCGHKNESRNDSLEDHILSRKADTYVNNFNILFKS